MHLMYLPLQLQPTLFLKNYLKGNTKHTYWTNTFKEGDWINYLKLTPQKKLKNKNSSSALGKKPHQNLITDISWDTIHCSNLRQRQPAPILGPSFTLIFSFYWPCAPPPGRWALWWHSCCGWCTPPFRSGPPASLPSISGHSAGRTRSQKERSTVVASGWRASPALPGPHLRRQRGKKVSWVKGGKVEKRVQGRP